MATYHFTCFKTYLDRFPENFQSLLVGRYLGSKGAGQIHGTRDRYTAPRDRCTETRDRCTETRDRYPGTDTWRVSRDVRRARAPVWAESGYERSRRAHRSQNSGHVGLRPEPMWASGSLGPPVTPGAPQSALRRSRGRLSLLTGGAVGARTGRSGGEVLWRQRSTVGLHEWGVVGSRVGGDRILLREVGRTVKTVVSGGRITVK